LSFKNTFLAIVDARTDIDDLVKLLYLKDALRGDALNKISIYDTSAENYRNAWRLLFESYDKKRILVIKHLDAVLDIKPVIKATSIELSRLVGGVRQYLSMLETLRVQLDQNVIILILERALPSDVRQKWEETLSLDKLPELTQLYKFVSKAAFRLNTMERDQARVNKTSVKRSAERPAYGAKFKRTGSGSRAFVTNASGVCGKCSANHPLHKCPVFEKMKVAQRWAFIKAKELCKNCLHHHGGTCKYSTRCQHCRRFYNTLLHSFEKTSDMANNAASSNVSASKTEQIKFKPESNGQL